MSPGERIAGDLIVAGSRYATVLPDFDFETYSEAGFRWDLLLRKWKSLPGHNDQKRGIKAVGARAYVTHPTFELTSLAYGLKDGRGRRHWKPGDVDPLDLFEHVRNGGLLEAHYSEFEWTVWTYYCVPVLGWPELRIEQLRCSASKCRAWGLPGALGDVGNVLDIEHKKDPDGDRLLKKLSVPRNPTKANPQLRLFPGDEPDEWQRLYGYNLRDLLAESEVSAKVPDLTPSELAVFLTDMRINDRGMAIDLQGVEDCIAVFEQAEEKYNHELRAIAGVEASDVQGLAKWLHGQGCHPNDMTAETLEVELKNIDRNATVQAARVYRAIEIRAMLASASVKKLYSMRAHEVDGRIHNMYMYYGARTGRVTGMDPQPTNLFKGEWHDQPTIERALRVLSARCLELIEYEYPGMTAIQVINNCLRSLFVAAPGKTLVCSDYSAIEGVVTAALAACEWRLDVFRTHGRIYEASAALICNIPFEEFERHKRETGKHHPMRNKIGKFAELASGFGGWIGAWKGFGADEFLSDEEIKDAILKWRAASPEIVELWGGQTRDRFERDKDPRPERFGLEGAAINAVEHPGEAFRYRDISFQVHRDVLYMTLPSGRSLTYHQPRLEPSTREIAMPWELELSFMGWNSNPKKGPLGWIRMKLYGGILTENAVQAVARDLQVSGLQRLEAAGYPVVMQTYDENAAEVDEGGIILGYKSLAEFEHLMTPTEDWARGWPVKVAGGWVGTRYGKYD